MTKQKLSSIEYLGLLSNVDESILNFPFEHGLIINKLPTTEASDLIGHLEGINSWQAYQKLQKLRCIDNKKNEAYFLTATADPNPSDDNFLGANIQNEFDLKVVHQYLHPLFQKMRLFNNGGILLSYDYYYLNYEKRNPRSSQHGGTILHIVEEKFSIDNSEISDLVKFVKKIKIPSSKSYIKLAFENFEMSYHVFPHHLEFLLLMISLESLFNPGREEIRYRISRSIAVLLGKDKSESELIFKEIREFYDKRSVLMHTGKNKISNNDIKRLRSLVRLAIKSLVLVNKKKDDVMMILNKSGFGDNPYS